MNRAEILDTARHAVTVDRAAAHGDAENNLGTIAAYWSAHLDTSITAHDVAVMMVLFKCARMRANPGHADSAVDAAGYSALAGEIGAGVPESEKRNSNPRWTQAEDDKAVKMAAQGYTAKQIAQELDRPTQGTSYRLSKVLRSRVKDAREKLSVPPVCAKQPPTTPPCHAFTADMDARLRRYMADGLGIGGATSMLRVHRDAVQARWDQLNDTE